jgi:glycerol-3-phosphate dehydrogenase
MPYMRAQVVFAVQNEMAQTIEDILARRLGLQLFDWRQSIRAAPTVAALLAGELGWPAEQQNQEVASYIGKINGFLKALELAQEGE